MAFSLTILGSNAAAPTRERNSSAQLLDTGTHLFLIDCAEGTQIQIRRMRVKFQRIRHIFISHLHGDHFFGLIGLLTTFHLLGRDKPLSIYAPEGLKEVIDHLLKVSDTTLVYPIHYHVTHPGKPGILYEDKHLTVSCFPLLHRVPTCGFLFREKTMSRRISKKAIADARIPVEAFPLLQSGQDVVLEDGTLLENDQYTLPPVPGHSYAYCCDTGYDENLPHWIQGVDWLFHEATFMEAEVSHAREKQHSTASDAARIATMANARHLILGHFSSRYKSLDLLLDEAKSIFANSSLAGEGTTLNLT